LLGAITVFANFASDILCVYLDPRVRVDH
jgi:ABC-type dipeptide/oligopeptide/nickel transport system permease component